MKHRFIMLALALVMGSIGACYAQLNKISFEEYDLDNGLHVILHQDNSTPIVAVALMYDVGSKHEDPSRTGFAHFFEHLMFEGTKHIERGEYFKMVQNAGGTLNANTSADRTYYYEILPSNQLELGLWMESERLLHAKVDSQGIATQKKVVIEEKKQSVDNRPYGTIMEETMKRAFKEHPYRWVVIGDPEHIMAARDDEFVSFYKKYYVPNNAVLVVAGDITIDQSKALVSKYFADIPKGQYDLSREKIIEPELKGEVRDTIFDNVQLPLILQAYRTPAMGTDDYYALSMLSTLLSQGQSSRLYKSLVDEQQKALQVGSFPMPYNEPTVSLAYALPNMGVDCKDLEDAMDAEIAKVRNELITDRELQKLKNQVENDIVGSNVKIAERTNNMARYYTYFKNTNLINTELDKFLAVTAQDIQRVAQKYLIEDNRVVLYYLPKSQKK